MSNNDFHTLRFYAGAWGQTQLPDEVATVDAALARIEADNERLREALRFYADESSYLWHWDEETNTQTRGTIQGNDKGAVARAALWGQP